MVLLYVVAGLGSEEGHWFGRGPLGLWPKLGPKKEGGREGAGRVREETKKVLGGGSRTSIISTEKSLHPFRRSLF